MLYVNIYNVNILFILISIYIKKIYINIYICCCLYWTNLLTVMVDPDLSVY